MNSIFNSVIHDSNSRDFDKLVLGVAPIELIFALREVNKYYYNLTDGLIEPAIKRDVLNIDITPIKNMKINSASYIENDSDVNNDMILQATVYNNYDVFRYFLKNYFTKDIINISKILLYQPIINNNCEKEQYFKIGKLISESTINSEIYRPIINDGYTKEQYCSINKLISHSVVDSYNIFRQACNDNKLLAAQRLYKYYPNIDIRKNKDSIFYECCIRRHIDIIQWLCQIVPNYSCKKVGFAYNPIVKN